MERARLEHLDVQTTADWLQQLCIQAFAIWQRSRSANKQSSNTPVFSVRQWRAEKPRSMFSFNDIYLSHRDNLTFGTALPGVPSDVPAGWEVNCTNVSPNTRRTDTNTNVHSYGQTESPRFIVEKPSHLWRNNEQLLENTCFFLQSSTSL